MLAEVGSLDLNDKCSVLEPQACHQGHIFSSKYPPPKYIQTVLLTGGQVVEESNLWGHLIQIRPPYRKLLVSGVQKRDQRQQRKLSSVTWGKSYMFQDFKEETYQPSCTRNHLRPNVFGVWLDGCVISCRGLGVTWNKLVASDRFGIQSVIKRNKSRQRW